MTPIKKTILAEIKKAHPVLSSLSDDDLDRLVFTRKRNIRLTYKGCALMKKMFDHHVIKFNSTQLVTKHLITLTNEFKLPYYLGPHTMVVFSDEDAIMIKLYGDPATFLSGMQPR